MIYQKALVQVQDFVRNYYSDHLNPNRIYHNLTLTQETVGWAAKIAEHYNFDSKAVFILETAGWFQGIYFAEDPANHERKDARLAEKMLKEWKLPDDIIKGVRNCILASRVPQKPKNLLEQIFCDAVMFDLAQADFWTKSKRMRQEFSLLTGKKVSKDLWQQKNIQLLQSHRFKTDYAKKFFTQQQEKNLEELIRKKPLEQDTAESVISKAVALPILEHTPDKKMNIVPESSKPSNDHTKAPEKKRPDRGIETMFRISSNNHQALSQMADNKAHIMITVNSIIISVLLSVLFRSLDNEPHLAIPVAILLIVNVITIIFSILATRPNIPPGTFSGDELNEQKVNLLFFGNFYKMPLNNYAEAMTELMGNRNFLYNSLIKNLHEQGIVLGKKYRFLRISYNVFMYGLVFAIVAFGIAILIND